MIPGFAMMCSPKVAGGSGSVKWWQAIRDASTTSVVFDLSDFSSLYQDTAATTPVTAAGQTVKAVANQGTGGGYATSSTGAVLTYDATNDKHYIVPPTTNGFKMTGVPAGLLGHISRSVIATGELPGNTAKYEYLFQLGLDSDGNYKRWVFGNVQDAGAFYLFSGGSGGGANAGSYNSGLHTWIGTSAAGTSDAFAIYRDGTTLVSPTGVQQCSPLTGTLSLGDYTTTNAARISKFYSLVMVDRVITSGERSDAVAGAL